MDRFWKWVAGIFGVLFVAAFAVLSFMAGSPKGRVRDGAIRPPAHASRHAQSGQRCRPDARIVALDGVSRFHIRERTHERPLVLVFREF